jgi:SNF2 family DNA or RNA helicase
MPELHDYQHQAVDHLHRHPRAGLFLDMGLGKTAVTLSALTPDHLPALVVAPKRVAEEVWSVERDIWRPDLSLEVAMGGPQERSDVLDRRTQPDVTVIGRDVLRDAVSRADRYRTLVLDELSGFKTKTSERWKAANKIANKAEHVWGLTGTPSPNGLLDLWGQIALLDHGQRLGKTLGTYRTRYFTPGRQLPNGVVIEYLLRPGAEARIHQVISDICLSMGTEGRIDLPPVTFNRVKTPLPPAARKHYQKMKDDLVVLLDLVGTVHTAANAAVMTSKLQQITSGFLYPDVDDVPVRGANDFQWLHDAKLDALEEIIQGTGSPILLFYNFQAELAAISRRFHVRQVHEHGAINDWNEGKIPIMVAHPASAGHGLNLQHGGHTAVWFSLPWNLEYWEQANKRLARQGQKHPVVIHTLEAPNSVDGSIYLRLRDKKSVQQALLSYLELIGPTEAAA